MPVRPTYTQRFLRFAWIAASFHGLPNRLLPAFLEQVLRVEAVSDDTVDNAMREIRSKQAFTQVPALGVTSVDIDDALVWTDWLRVDEIRLGLTKALIRIPNEGWDVWPLVDALRGISGVRQIIVTKEDWEVLAVVLFRTEEEGKDIRARIQEHAGRLPNGVRVPVRMHTVEFETHEPTRRTWLDIAMREAAEAADQ